MVELQSIFMSKSKNLSLLLSDNHLTEHVAGTEEILKADLVRIPPENEFLHIFFKVCQANIAICKSANHKGISHRPGRKM